ncbi:MAG: NAD(P)H-hydrate dehydratase [Candidatus Dadabacteria bacterium]|nr:NAD(P)H-hydrate dehydratase [Candidatus Dadabacteria bacterium]
MKLATREIIRNIDRQSIEEYGVLGLVLMENAGRAASSVILGEFPRARSAAVFAGGGNNGGDGFVIARHLRSAGLEVTAYLASDPEKLAGDALTNYNALRSAGAEIVKLNGRCTNYVEADVVVDALLGTGLTRDVEGFYAKVIRFINGLAAPKVAVDLPSGLDADTGFPLGEAVKADVTVTFVLPKLGLAVYPGIDYAGRVYVADITTPKFLEEDIPYELITYDSIRGYVAPREGDTHKGTYGHLLILAGSPGKTGAAMLVARGAGRVGTGLVTVGVPSGLNPIFEGSLLEAMTEPLPESVDGCLGKDALDYVLNVLLKNKTALVIGPGISTEGEIKEFVNEIVLCCEAPVVIDADGITVIAQEPGVLKEMKAPCVLTPHPGEMSRLTGATTKEVQRNRVEIARDFAAMYNVYVVLKGARTVVAEPGGRVFVNPTGNPGMATGGTGDVLSGVIGGLLAQRLDPRGACSLGVFAHGLAGDMCREAVGEAGMLAGDIAEMVPGALREISLGEEGEFGGREFFITVR